MENNRNENGNCQQNGSLHHLEELLIHERLANFVRNKVDKNLFLQWKDRLCRIKSDDRNVMLFLMLNGANEEENKEKLDEILDALKEAEDHFRECDETERFNVKFKLTHRMLIPEQKCRFIIGTGGESIRKLREDCNLLKAYIDNGEREPLPQGYGRLIMISDNVDGLRQARSEIGYSLRIASSDYNLRGLTNGNGKRLSNEDGNVRETLKFPADLNQKQREKWQQILKESCIDFKIFNDSIELCGAQEKVIEIKDQLAATLNGMTTQKWECIDILVPFPNFRYVFGQNGDTIKAIQAKFEVRLIFQGENHEEYPNGRWLKIKGRNKEKVEKARAHIEANYCMKRDGNGNWPAKREENWPKREMGDDEPEVQKEMTLPELVATKVLKMKIENEVNDYEFRRGLRDGNQRVVLKGSRAQLIAAEAKLKKYCQELAKNGRKWPKWEESSKSGSEGNEGGKPKQYWIMPGEEKENDRTEIVMNEQEDEEEEFKMKKTSGNKLSDCLMNEKSLAEEKKTSDISTYKIDSGFGTSDHEGEELEENESEEERSNEDEDDEKTEEEEEDNDDEEMNAIQELEGGNGNATSQTMLEMLFAKMTDIKEVTDKALQEMNEITEKALQEIKKEEYQKIGVNRCLEKRIAHLEGQKNAHIQRLEKKILRLEQRILASELQ